MKNNNDNDVIILLSIEQEFLLCFIFPIVDLNATKVMVLHPCM